MKITALGLLMATAGCSLLPGGPTVEKAIVGVTESGVADRMAYNDKKAELLLRLPCDVSVGAYFRLRNPIEQQAIIMLCNPGNTLPPTVGR